MNAIRLFLTVCALSVLSMLSGIAVAQTATNLICTDCVSSGDIAVGAVKTDELATNAVTTTKIKNNTVTFNKLSVGVRGQLDGAIAIISTLGVTDSQPGSAIVDCPSDRIVVSASCDCFPNNPDTNLGVLFGCVVTGNSALVGCVPEALNFDPNLAEPLANVQAVCMGATSSDGTPWVPTANGLTEFKSNSDTSQATLMEVAQWRKAQREASEASLAKYRELIERNRIRR